jgi:hypothetical protein
MMHPGYIATPAVRHAEVDGLRVLLDLNTESYSILDDVASVFWSVLIGESNASATMASLAQTYDVDDSQLSVDLAAFAEQCVSKGLLARADSLPSPSSLTVPAPPPRNRRTRPGTIRALLSLIATRNSLARHGFRTTYERYARLPAGPAECAPDAALLMFSRAENFFIARRAPGDCLVRSLSLYRFLRSVNIPAEHVIGVRRFAFSAHAWVEYQGSPLLDDRARTFTPLSRIGTPPPEWSGGGR